MPHGRVWRRSSEGEEREGKRDDQSENGQVTTGEDRERAVTRRWVRIWEKARQKWV